MRFSARKRHDEIDDEIRACRHTLVVHADGTQECEGVQACGCEVMLHEWWLPCDELGCGCVGEEHDAGLEPALLLAA